ncbi:MAG: LPS-assembly protein LptD, partial [Acidobacteriota bacterium]
DRFSSPSRHQYRLEGNVTFRSGGVLLQADRIIYDNQTRKGEATGNVLYVQGPFRVSGDHVSFDLAAETAEMEDATGYMDQGFLFRAKKVIQLDRERVRFEKGFFTACTQPVPYWSFQVQSGVIVKDHYVHLKNLRLKAGHVPVFYAPYLIFPVKPDRATGLLLPQLGFSQRLGSSLGNAFFWDIRRNQDATFFLDLFTQGTVGTGAEYRFVPNSHGAVIFNGYFIDESGLDPDEGPGRNRWNVRFKQRQDLSGGAQVLSNFNFVSDADYNLDFSRDLDRGSDPSALSRAEYILNRGSLSLNLRGERRQQFFASGDVIQTRLPEAEIRLRSLRLGSSPLFLGLEGSSSLLERSGPNFPSGAYGRFDLFPTLTLPLTPLPYLDITPTLRLRETYYTRALRRIAPPGSPGPTTSSTEFGSALSRRFVQFELQTQGPRLSRIFFDKEGNGRLKSTLEPRIVYRFQTTPNAEENDRVPAFDEIDLLPGDLNQVEYGLFSRLFARKVVHTGGSGASRTAYEDLLGTHGKRERVPSEEGGREPGGPSGTTDAAAGASPAGGETVPDQTGSGGRPGEPAGGTAAGDGDGEALEKASPGRNEAETVLTSPVEIASFSITQRYSFMAPLSFDTEAFDSNGDGVINDLDTTRVVNDSPSSPVTLSGRINPSRGTSIDLRFDYDTLEKAISSASISAGLFGPRSGFLNGTWFFRNGLDGLTKNSSRLRVSGGTSFFRHKISMAVALNYDSTVARFQDQRYRLGYDTQCCGFAVELLQRNFDGTNQREFRFVINLRGIGNFLDLQSGGAGR